MTLNQHDWLRSVVELEDLILMRMSLSLSLQDKVGIPIGNRFLSEFNATS